ncbi:MAG: FAD-dependent oxidoreductase, partial [Spirochaetaceae bacterium]|nr:FAD-dependent oxidoreductase [Spirochaetaceae bacterium]
MAIYRIPELKLPLDHSDFDIRQRVARELNVPPEAVLSWRVERKSVDARDRSAIKIVYGVAATLAGTSNARRHPALAFPPAPLGGSYLFPEPRRAPAGRPVIVGAGPAGLFCALLLAERGLRPLVLERGGDVDSRIASIDLFWKTGRLDPDSNMQFGEGGAGTFSDGKLNTTVNDPSGRNGKVLAEFVAAGAPEEIGFLSKPHIGTDLLVGVVRNLRRKIEALGGEVRFRAKVTSLLVEGGRTVGVVVDGSESIPAGAVVLAVGHSARDVFERLARDGVPMEPKAFAIGVRIEHPQEMISRNQFGASWRHPALPVADYKLTARASDGRGVYSFCMCPGGQVVNASSEEGGVACNGMSDFARGGRNANSAIVVQVGPEDFDAVPAGLPPVLAGVEFQRRWERLAFAAGGGDFALPVQTLADFRDRRASTALGGVKPDIRGPWRPADITGALPPGVVSGILDGLGA